MAHRGAELSLKQEIYSAVGNGAPRPCPRAGAPSVKTKITRLEHRGHEPKCRPRAHPRTPPSSNAMTRQNIAKTGGCPDGSAKSERTHRPNTATTPKNWTIRFPAPRHQHEELSKRASPRGCPRPRRAADLPNCAFGAPRHAHHSPSAVRRAHRRAANTSPLRSICARHRRFRRRCVNGLRPPRRRPSHERATVATEPDARWFDSRPAGDDTRPLRGSNSMRKTAAATSKSNQFVLILP